MRKHLRPDTFAFVKKSLLFAIVFCLFNNWNQVYAQCGLSGFSAAGPLNVTNAFQTVNAGSGTYVEFNVSVGNIYSFKFNTLSDPSIPANKFDMTLSSTSSIINYNNSLTPLPYSWNNGVSCTTTQIPSAEWYATYNGVLRVNIHEYNPGTCADWVSGGGSATLAYKACPVQPDPGVGNFNWKVDAFATTDASIPIPAARYGSYTDNISDLNFSSGNYWTSAQTPANASTWTGCAMPPENWVIRARRKGFTCGAYRFRVNSVDDGVEILLNGVDILPYTVGASGFYGSTTGYMLGANDIVEIRGTALCATNQFSVSVVPQTPTALNGGAIHSDQLICEGSTAAALTDSITPSGGYGSSYVGGGYTYDWVYQDSGCTGTPTYVNNNSLTYAPGALFTSTCFARQVTDACGVNTRSNGVNITVNTKSVAPGAPTASPSTICNTGSSTLTVNGGSLGTGASWHWYSSSCGGTAVGTGSSVTVNPATTTTYFVRAEGPASGPCLPANTSCSSVIVTVSQPSTAPTGVQVSTNPVCSGSPTTLTVQGGFLGTGANWVWYSGACGAGGTFVASGPSITVNPTSNTTYYVRAESICDTSACASAAVVVNTLSITPGSISGTSPICLGQSSVLHQVGGTLGTGAAWQWYTKGCGLTSEGTGDSITVTPTVTTTYYLRGEGTCNNTNCLQFTVVVQDSSVPAASINGTSPICNGQSSLLSVNGGVLGTGAGWVWYTASCGGSIAGTGSTLTVNPSGTTTYYLRAEGTCNTTICQQFTVAVNPTPTGFISSDTSICAGNSAQITFHFTSGTGPFNISYSANGTVNSLNGVNDGDVITVTPGTTTLYQYTSITDANTCNSTSGFGSGATVTVTPLPIINSVDTVGVSCFGGSNGQIIISVSSGTPPIYYSVDGGTNFFTTSTFNTLIAGTYNVVVHDTLGCARTYAFNPVVVNQPAVLTFTDSTIDASCANVFDGKITVYAAGGTYPYNYSLNGGPAQSGNAFTGLSAGAYLVQVTDAHGCTDTATVTINNSYIISDSILSQTNVSCFGGSNGAVTVQLTGGVPPYTYSINGVLFQPSPTFTGLTAGSYVVTLRDSRGCTAFLPVTITQPAQLSVHVDSIKNVGCYGTATGIIYITASGGTGSYTYSWDNSETTRNDSNLVAGTYSVTVSDANSCSAFASGTVTQPQPLFVGISSFQNLKCYNDSSGSINLSVSGGLPPYTFLWSNSATTQDLNNLSANTYTVTVTDFNGCTGTASQAITQPGQLSSTYTSTNNLCFGDTIGSVDLTVNGGTAPFTYLWSNGATTQDISNLAANTYTVIITDAHNCISTNAVTITAPNAISISKNISGIGCNGATTGSITLIPSGGTPGYNYNWSVPGSGPTISGLGAGTYYATVSDNNGCRATDSTVLSQPTAIVINGTVGNVSCAGGNGGSVTISVNGGTFPYTYLWSPGGQTTQNLTNLNGGVYSVVVTDAASCTMSASFTVAEPAGLVDTVAHTNLLCHGDANGTATVTGVGGGIAPYTFQWSTFQTTQSISGLNGGTYYVVIKDANGCTQSDSVVVFEPTAIQHQLTVVNATCNGAANGSITVIASGGTGTLGYTWSVPGNTATINNLGTGTYYVTVNDGNGCTVTDSATIAQPTAIVINGTVGNVTCAGGNGGSITLGVNGGTFPYTYLWSPGGQTTQNLTNLNGGVYSVVVTDAASCTMSASFTVAEPAALVDTVAHTDLLCHGDANGTASVTGVGGGIAPYTFLWSTFQTTQSISGLSGGTYYVIIKDANGCTKNDSVVVIEPSAIQHTISVVNIACNGSATGSVTVTASGGTGTLNYTWSVPGSGPTISGLNAGTYYVTISDANGCSAVDSGTVTQTSALSYTDSVKNVSCNGAADGAISITVTGGTAPYTYVWTNSSGTGSTITGLSPNTYSVTVTDANSCGLTASFTVSEPAVLNATISHTDLNCHGDGNGTASVTQVTGGTAPYSYLWNTFQISSSISGLNGGTYYVIVTDAHGCIHRDSAIVVEPAALSSGKTVVNATCNGAATGSITLNVSGGTPSYAYTWSVPGSGPSITNLTAGTYYFTITDSHNCSIIDSATVSQPTAMVLNGTVADVTCAGGNGGSISITVNGGTFPYTYLWSPGGQTTQNLTNLNGGNYSVVVTDAASCTISASFTVSEPAPLAITLTHTDLNCHGDGNGTAGVTQVTGGIAPYTYLWSTFQTTQSISSLNGGTYFVIVKDANGCTQTDSVVVIEPSAIQHHVTVTNILCSGSSTGSVTVTASGGTGALSYGWSVPGSGPTISNLPAGTYYVTITDNNGCTAVDSGTVTSTAALAYTDTVTNVSCNGAADGSISIFVTGGTQPYTYTWTNSTGTGPTISGLSPNTYDVTVLDANSCSVTAEFVVTEPAVLSATISHTDLNCHGDANGTATVSNVQGGTGPYTYLWSTFQITPGITNLNGGTYYVIITDAHGCQFRDSAIVVEPGQLLGGAVVQDVTCNGTATGSITLNVSGGTPTYTYTWSVPGNGSSITNLTAGTYYFTITDSHNCSVIDSAVVHQPTAMVLNGTVVDVACAGGHSGSIAISVNGGNFPYTYLWSPGGQTTQNINNQNGGNYTVVVTDASSCTISASFTIAEPTAITDTIIHTDVNCPGGNNGTATLTVQGGTQPYSFLWSTFQSAQSLTGLHGGIYYVVITDANGCTHRDSTTIFEPQPIVIRLFETDASCNGTSTGTVTSTVTGGTPGYTYFWSNNTTNPGLNGVPANEYYLTVTDSHGCTNVDSIKVGEPTALVVVGDSTNVSCGGGSNGTINVSVGGGTAPYTYLWDDGSTTPNVTGLAAGTHTVTVTDFNGCTATLSFTLTEPTPIVSAVTHTDVTCHGFADGTTTLNVGGGTPPYTFLWSNLAVTQNLTNLSGGGYNVLITDANGCQKRDGAVVFEPALLLLHIDSLFNITCHNSNDGRVYLSTTGGRLPYSYLWNDNNTSTVRTNLQGGTYTVTVSDSAGLCSSSQTLTIVNPPSVLTSLIIKNELCFQDTLGQPDSTGSISLAISGGTPSYIFTWRDTFGTIIATDTNRIDHIPAGQYTIEIEDAHGCMAFDTARVTGPPVYYVSGFVFNPTCHGYTNGYIFTTAYGGTPPYTYQWIQGSNQTTQNLNNIPGGTYGLYVTDNNGCPARSVYHVYDPPLLVSNIQLIDSIKCFGKPTAHVLDSVSGGTPPYVYLWNDFSVDRERFGLTAGLYSVMVKDTSGCQAFDSITITQPSQIQIAGQTADAICFGGASGAITETTSGGTPNYNYLWTPGGATSQNITGLTAGTYVLRVTDANQCVQSDSFIVGQPTEMFVNTLITKPTCHGSGNGAVSAVATQGVPPYSFAWNTTPQQNTATASDLVAGVYIVTVTDSHGCSVSATDSLSQPDSLIVITTADSAKCYNTPNGRVVVTVQGGHAPYIYDLNGIVQGTNIFYGLLPGEYTMLVTDLNGCDGLDSFRITSPTAITVSLSVSDQVILTGMQTQLVASATPDDGNLRYFWNPVTMDSVDVFDYNGATGDDTTKVPNPYVRPPFTQTFTVFVMNKDSCFASDTVTVYVKNEQSAFIPSAFTPNGDGLNDRFTFDILGATTIDIVIFDRWGGRVYVDNAQPNGISNSYGWDGKSNGKDAPSDTYVYQMNVKYFDGTIKKRAGTVTLMR